MKKLTVCLPGRGYDIILSPGLIAGAGNYFRETVPGASRVGIITDSNVSPLYAPALSRALEAAGYRVKVIEVPPGERSKSVPVLEYLYDELLSFGLTRTDAVAALGGGVVGDLAGFAAATVLRGVDFIQLPTTLLAQVDSSVGGKVAVNLKAGKNLAGAFWQPRLVLADTGCLATLPDPVFADGMAEVIKYGCILDEPLFRLLEASPSRAAVMGRVEEVLYACCACKASVVERDERDTGERMLLNFGHTFGHAYELAGGYEIYTHGQAVAAGMCLAAKLGVKLGVTPPELPARIGSLVRAFGLPDFLECTPELYAAAVGLDKKGGGDSITLILLGKLGGAVPYKTKKADVHRLLEEVLSWTCC
jgi:3-dehydroquinate synthase